MTEGTQPDNGSSDDVDGLVRGLVSALSDSGDKPVPAATTDATEVIKSQLTENTGRHLLDSGSAYGRHWEENQESPPWDQPAWTVNDSWVTHNVYDFMSRRFSRDSACVALEVALYGYAYSDDRKRDSWLQCMESFAEAILSGDLSHPQLQTLGVPSDAADDVLGVQYDLAGDRHRTGPVHRATDPMTINTYNGENHTLSQCLQGTNLGGPHAEYVLVQVHGGCDIRGGYTAPRVYTTSDGWIPGELWFDCQRCGWSDAESCIYGEESLMYQPSPDYAEVEEVMIEARPAGVSVEEAREAAAEVVNDGHGHDHQDGAVFHDCGDGVGVVRFS